MNLEETLPSIRKKVLEAGIDPTILRMRSQGATIELSRFDGSVRMNLLTDNASLF